MSVKSVQFAVAAHIMAALGYFQGEEISSATLADGRVGRSRPIRREKTRCASRPAELGMESRIAIRPRCLNSDRNRLLQLCNSKRMPQEVGQSARQRHSFRFRRRVSVVPRRASDELESARCE